MMIRIPLDVASGQAELDTFAGTQFADWVGVPSTYAMFRDSAQRHGDRPALTHLPTGSLDDVVSTLSYTELFDGIIAYRERTRVARGAAW